MAICNGSPGIIAPLDRGHWRKNKRPQNSNFYQNFLLSLHNPVSCAKGSIGLTLPYAHGPSRAASLMLSKRCERADNKLDKA